MSFQGKMKKSSVVDTVGSQPLPPTSTFLTEFLFGSLITLSPLSHELHSKLYPDPEGGSSLV